ncbi:MAG: BlaI/MecI/CopY family transcriptional regulator [Clostridiales Family XIII bacterium]|jgi:predicted transcriptional regulator|nr:BlaI/MecI/CopY family transcriptional regulator [Clostridiales Family XIII bacterium]
MVDYRLAEMESRFADLIWENEPINSTELVHLSQERMKWKKSTTYTILKRLCDRGIFKNEGAVVSAVISRAEFFAGQSQRFVEDTFGGSLPRFLASFIGGGKLSEKQAEELIRLINEHKKD